MDRKGLDQCVPNGGRWNLRGQGTLVSMAKLSQRIVSVLHVSLCFSMHREMFLKFLILVLVCLYSSGFDRAIFRLER